MKKCTIRVSGFLLVIVLSLTLVSVPVTALEDNKFSDVTSDKWYYNEVQRASDEGIMEGTSKDTFEPNGTVTREMFVTALARLILGKDAVDGMDNYYIGKFKDKKISEYWYTAPIMWATKIELTNGIDKNTFGIGVAVTREQIATFIKRYIDYHRILLPTLDAAADKFSDTPSEYAKDAVELMRITGIVKGVGNGRFDPKANATRAEVAAMLLRFKDALENSTYGVNIDAEKVSRIELRDASRLGNGYPHEITVTDKADIEYIVSVINQPIKEVVFLETCGWTYGIKIYDNKDNIIFSATVHADHYYENGYFYYAKQDAFKPIINYIKAH